LPQRQAQTLNYKALQDESSETNGA
jgi:hypothetical protein